MGEGLAGRRVVIARAGDQIGRLRELLVAEGAEVIEVPTIAVVDPDDGGAALRTSMRDLWDWVVVTSPNGAERAVAAAGGAPPPTPSAGPWSGRGRPTPSLPTG